MRARSNLIANKDNTYPGGQANKNLKKLTMILKRDFYLYLLLTLPMLYFIIFKYLPMYGVIIAFKNYNIFEGTFKSPWIGLDNFIEIFTMGEFYRVLRNTFLLNFLDLFFGFPAPIILALIINEVQKARFKKVTQTILYLPHFLSWIIIGGILYQLFSTQTGMVNEFINRLGFKPIPFLTDEFYWIITYTATGIWQNAGWGTIIYLAAITSISSELYEAASIDGAGRLRKIWHITLSGIKPTIIMLLILNVGRIASISFDRPFVLGNALVMDYSDVISTFVYRVGLQSSRFSIATAVGLFQSVIGLIFLLSTNYIANKNGEHGIW